MADGTTSRADASAASTKLAGQAQGALQALVRGFQAADEADPRGRGELLRDVLALAENRAQVYGGLLTTIMRLVFVLYAEDRGLLPGSGIDPGSSSVTGLFDRLREDALLHREAMLERYGAWAELLARFRELHERGLHDGPPACEAHVPARAGRLFDPDAYPFLEGRAHGTRRGMGEPSTPPLVSDGAIYEVLGLLLFVDGERISYQALEVEQIGSIYEAMMGFTLEQAGAPPGALYLQPTKERRRSGSHYTPRELTEPIVRATLQPQLDALAAGATPRAEQILGLKVCDPAMGSGAFLIASCRFLGGALDAAWSAHGDAPTFAPDEDRALHARRLVAQRCLYGVDKNPFAVDLAKLSLWLFTRAKDHPFTFLDHALRQGDSLVGLSQEQVVRFTWKDTGSPARKDAARPALAPGPLPPADLRAIADLAVLAFFSEKTDAAREKRRKLLADTVVEPFVSCQLDGRSLRERANELQTLTPSVTPFHWEIELPEVFAREDPGFDSFVGNPPFAGKNTLIAMGGAHYIDWLKALHEGSHGNADLVAHFFRRAFSLLRRAGTLGFIATNTVAQGDTRGTGLRWIRDHGGLIFEATRRKKWPGAAAVVVSVVHVARGGAPGAPLLDDRPAPVITAFLFHRGGDDDPAPLRANQGRAFLGTNVVGEGFKFDDTDTTKQTWPLAVMRQVTARDPRNADRIFPLLGGEECNDSPTHTPHRFIIDFGDMSEPEARLWPDLMALLEERVRPRRQREKREAYRRHWWRHGERRVELYRALASRPHVFVCSQTSKYRAFARVPARMVFSTKTVVFIDSTWAMLALLQARPHELWSTFFGSSMKDDPVYTPSDCFETFPFPEGWRGDAALESIGQAYYELRAALMVRNNEGLTRTYNRFHDPGERSAEIRELRALHAAMDRAVLDAYGFCDVPNACEFFLEHDERLGGESGGRKERRRKPYRYRWPDEVRDEVLARLIELNRVRAEDERKRG